MSFKANTAVEFNVRQLLRTSLPSVLVPCSKKTPNSAKTAFHQAVNWKPCSTAPKQEKHGEPECKKPSCGVTTASDPLSVTAVPDPDWPRLPGTRLGKDNSVYLRVGCNRTSPLSSFAKHSWFTTTESGSCIPGTQGLNSPCRKNTDYSRGLSRLTEQPYSTTSSSRHISGDYYLSSYHSLLFQRVLGL